MSSKIDDLDRLIRDIPAMPVVAQRVMHMLGDPRTTNSILGEALSADPSMVARILQMANSPFFGTRQKISSVNNAIFVLGHSALRSLVITVCTKGIFKNPGLMEEMNWQYSLGTAAAARHIATRTGLMDSDEAFIAGLLHQIGRIMLMVQFAEAYRAIFALDYNDGLPLDELRLAEREEFGYDHCQIGARVIEKWRLPSVYVSVAKNYYLKNSDTLEGKEDASAIAVIAEAGLLARRLGIGRREPDKSVEVIATIYNRILDLDKEHVLDILEKTFKEYTECQDQFRLGTEQTG